MPTVDAALAPPDGARGAPGLGPAAAPRGGDFRRRRSPPPALVSSTSTPAGAGLLASPLLGWGPGSVPLTIAEFLRPIPGVNPPSEILGDLHSLPLQILYELGATGFLLTLGTAALFLRRRVTERDGAEDPTLLAAGLIGLLGAAVTRLGGASLAITALPLAAGIAAGAALAAQPRREPPGLPLGSRWSGRLYAVVAMVALLPGLRAAGLYDRATRASEPALASEALAEAIALDPGFPLYRARRAWLEGAREPRPAIARDALRAAEDARGVALLWLAAGRLGRQAGEPWAADALARSAALDPLGASAPFELVLAAPASPRAAEWARPRSARGAALSARHLLARSPRVARRGGASGRDAGGRRRGLARGVGGVCGYPGTPHRRCDSRPRCRSPPRTGAIVFSPRFPAAPLAGDVDTCRDRPRWLRRDTATGDDAARHERGDVPDASLLRLDACATSAGAGFKPVLSQTATSSRRGRHSPRAGLKPAPTGSMRPPRCQRSGPRTASR